VFVTYGYAEPGFTTDVISFDNFPEIVDHILQ